MEVDAFLEREGERHIRNAKNTAQVMVPASKAQRNFRTSKVSVETGEKWTQGSWLLAPAAEASRQRQWWQK